MYNDLKQLRWKWGQIEPFGTDLPNENPVNLGAFELPLRFPGQYADKETGLFYNYFRNYDPRIGRYEESDPMGLFAEVNTYTYAQASPLTFTDPLGLCPPSIDSKSGSARIYGPLVRKTGECTCPGDTLVCTYDLVIELCSNRQCVAGPSRLIDVPYDCDTGQLFSPRLGRPRPGGGKK